MIIVPRMSQSFTIDVKVDVKQHINERTNIPNALMF